MMQLGGRQLNNERFTNVLLKCEGEIESISLFTCGVLMKVPHIHVTGLQLKKI